MNSRSPITCRRARESGVQGRRSDLGLLDSRFRGNPGVRERPWGIFGQPLRACLKSLRREYRQQLTLSNPTSTVRPWACERVFVPHSGHCAWSVWTREASETGIRWHHRAAVMGPELLAGIATLPGRSAQPASGLFKRSGWVNADREGEPIIGPDQSAPLL